MHESLLLGVAIVFVLGLGAQWLAWRFRLPSILRLLAFGFQEGAAARTIPITDRDTFGHLLERYGEVVTPLFLVCGSQLSVFSRRSNNPVPQAGEAVDITEPSRHS